MPRDARRFRFQRLGQTISGQITDGADVPAREAILVLAPSELKLLSFPGAVKTVRPGEYILLAWEDADTELAALQEFRAEFLKFAKKVEV